MGIRTQLLATFVKRNKFKETISSLIEYYEILFNKIYVFQNENDFHQLICTYNIEENRDNFVQDRDTISLHRKKQTNTLYTINALNNLIRELNEGVLDKTFSIPWENYSNCLLLTTGSEVNLIPTRIYTIVDINTWAAGNDYE